MEESKVIPGTVAGSFDEVKGIAEALGNDVNVTSLIPGQKPGDFSHIGIPLTLGDMIAAAQGGASIIAADMTGVGVVSRFDGVGTEITRSSPGIGIVDQGQPYYPPKPSNFEMCAEINYLVGNVIDPSIKTAEAQKKVIECEWEEFLESIANKDMNQLRDDVGDMLFTVYGMAARMGFPADLDFKAICESQYSKFDKTASDQALTAAKYDSIGVATYYEVKTRNDGTRVWVTYSSKDQTGSDKKFYPAGKWLKSVNFKEPVFTLWEQEGI